MNNMNMNAQAPLVEDGAGVNRFYGKVYGIFAVGLGISAIAAFLCSQVFPQQTINFVNSFPLGFFGLWIVEMILVLVLAAKAKKNPALSIAGFVVYALLNGVVLSITLAYYTSATVYQAFVAASATFAASALVGVFTKKDLSMVGRVARTALLGVIITSVLNIFIFKSSGLNLGIAYISVAIFTGLTAYDNQMIRVYYQQTKGTENTGIAAFVALQLYLDFINLLLAFLRIFGNND